MFKHMTNEQKQKYMTDTSTWPVCKNCGKLISWRKFNKPNSRTGKKYTHWKNWQKTKYCCQRCAAKGQSANNKKMWQSKKCAKCGVEFHRPPDMPSKNWASIKNCPEHRLNKKKSVDTKAELNQKPIAPGFYVFEMR